MFSWNDKYLVASGGNEINFNFLQILILMKILPFFFLFVVVVVAFVRCGHENVDAEKPATVSLNDSATDHIPNDLHDSVIYLQYRLRGLSNDLILDFFQEFGLDSVNVSDERLYTNREATSRVVNHFISLIDDKEYQGAEFVSSNEWPRLNYWELILLNLPDEAAYDKTYDGYLGRREQEKSFAATLFSLDRSADNVSRLWTLTRPVVYASIPRERFFRTGYYKYVDGLLNTYDFILKQDEPRVVFELLNRKLSEYDYYGTYGSKHIYASYVPVSVFEAFSEPPHDVAFAELLVSDRVKEEYNTTQTAWFVSFWQRRFNEGNMEMVRNILSEIQNHYDQDRVPGDEQGCYEITIVRDSIVHKSNPIGNGSTFLFDGEVYSGGHFADAVNQLIVDAVQNAALGEKKESFSVLQKRPQQVLNEIDDIGAKLVADFQPLEEDDTGYTFEVNSSISGRTGRYITVGIGSWSYTGGAHGNGYSAYHVYDCIGDSLVDMARQIVREKELLAKISRELKQYAGGDENSTLQELGFWEVGLPANFNISDGKVEFVYNAYEIGPYVMGSPTVSFPIEEMRKYFLLEF